LARVSPTDFGGVKEIAELPDSISLRNIYRVPLGKRGDISVWVVDGAAMRRDIYPDFGLSANDLACHFIPPNEIWIDGQISCEETEFSIATELYERELMAKGKSYDDAYEQAISAVRESRKKTADASRRKLGIVIPKNLDRDVGTGDEK
jgi:capsid protein